MIFSLDPRSEHKPFRFNAAPANIKSIGENLVTDHKPKLERRRLACRCRIKSKRVLAWANELWLPVQSMTERSPSLDQVRFSCRVRTVEQCSTNDMLVSVIYFDQVIGVIRKFGTGDHVQRYLLPK